MTRQPSAIMKYFEPLDKFIRIRIFSGEQVAEALDADSFNRRSIVTKEAYMVWLAKIAVVNFETDILPRIKERFGKEHLNDVLVSLHQDIVSLNPRLEIHQVQIPIMAEGDAVQEDTSSLFVSPLTSIKNFCELIRRKLPVLESGLRMRIIGQDEAINAIISVLTRAAAGIRDYYRPIGSMLFMGFTGVGKTELVKATSDILFGPGRLARIDCSEYAQAHEYAKILGAPPGYVGHETGSEFCKQMISCPQSVVLFDEIEKADPRIYDLLLQILEDGQLTTGKGEVVDFTQALIFITSNIGTREAISAQNRAGFKFAVHDDPDTKGLGFVQALERDVPPEFLNRIDRTIVFRQLDGDDAAKITGKMMLDLNQRIRDATEGGWGLNVSAAARQRIVADGFSRAYGARELRRTIQQQIEDPIAERMVRPGFPTKGTMSVSIRGDGFFIKAIPSASQKKSKDVS